MPPPIPETSRPATGRRLCLAFLGGWQREIGTQEITLVLRHPYVMGFYLVVAGLDLLIGFARLPHGSVEATTNLRIPITFLGVSAGLAAAILTLHLAARFGPRKGAKRGAVRVHLSLPLLICILVAQGTEALLLRHLLGIPYPSAGFALAIVLAFQLLGEGYFHFGLRPLADRILRDIRTEPLDAGDSLPAPAAPAATLVSGPVSVPADTVLRLSAQGNYVQLFTGSGTRLLPGPLSSLVEQLPQGMGCLVHRSEWVATRMVASASRQGRSITLSLRDGETVRVASSRTDEVRDWLAQFPAPPRRRRDQSTGGGDTKRQSRPAPVTTTSAIGGTAPSAPSASVTPTKS
ncbi:LytTR family transcriptional regulator DNA-binding domain-containing protein [Paragemmobacter straminiformis]|uniref:LytTR family transcriptional regulator n=1 Tax=Paragemmobacter straminiformis TaxID=2045119 RepID=A0A842IBS2_9RHOB|nr:LytTR family transcriptional regulator [Gemmobacter straminiformis]